MISGWGKWKKWKKESAEPLHNSPCRKTRRIGDGHARQFMTKNLRKNFPQASRWGQIHRIKAGKSDSPFFVQLVYHYSRYPPKTKNSGKNQCIGRVNGVFDTAKWNSARELWLFWGGCQNRSQDSEPRWFRKTRFKCRKQRITSQKTRFELAESIGRRRYETENFSGNRPRRHRKGRGERFSVEIILRDHSSRNPRIEAGYSEK